MNVLMLNYEYPPLGGGGGKVCQNLSEMLVRRKDQVSVVTMAFQGLRGKENCRGVRVHRVPCWRSRKTVCHPWEQLTYCVSAYRYIRRKMNIRQYDVVHCHFIIPTGLLALWLKKTYGIRYVVTAQGSDVPGHNDARFKYLYKVVKPLWIMILKNAEVITAPSSYLADKIRDSYPKADCRIIPNGIFTSSYTSGEREKSIITVSRLQKSKGIQDLVEACAKLDMGEWKVNILGEGPYRKEIGKLIQKYHLQDRVFLRGYVSEEEHLHYLKHASIYFTGSWFEAMPVSVLEAMASRNVVIASDIAPHRQLLPEECIYESLDELINKLRNRMSETDFVKEYPIEEYDWENVVQQYRYIYQQVRM